MAVPPGFEPGPFGSEPSMLPLHQGTTKLADPPGVDPGPPASKAVVQSRYTKDPINLLSLSLLLGRLCCNLFG